MRQHIFHHPRSMIVGDMGLGKTAGTLLALTEADRVVDIFPILVLGPKRVANLVWSAEAANWELTKQLKFSIIVGTEKQRLTALHNSAHVYTCNYENLPWLRAKFGKRWPFKTVVADESRRLKSFRLRQGSLRAGVLADVAFDTVERWINLTGTPVANGYKDLWGQMWFVDRGKRLGYSFSAYAREYFYAYGPYNALALNANSAARIQHKIKDVCLILRAEDYLSIKKPAVIPVPVRLSPTLTAQYKRLEQDLMIALNGRDVLAFNAGALTLKCLQFASGAMYVGESNKQWVVIHNEKIEAIRSIVEECSGDPLIVAYHFVSDLDRLKKAFPHARYLHGNAVEDAKLFDDWNAGKIEMLLLHPGSAGHGLSLQHGGHRIAFFSHWWALEDYQQIIERIGPTRQLQSGYDRVVYIYNVFAEGTLDEEVIARRQNKNAVQNQFKLDLRG